jgi:hypothetical protein
VQEELLDSLESVKTNQLPLIGDICKSQVAVQPEAPTFIPMPIPQNKGAAVTVWVGTYAVDIQNGADDSVVEQVLRVVSRI